MKIDSFQAQRTIDCKKVGCYIINFQRKGKKKNTSSLNWQNASIQLLTEIFSIVNAVLIVSDRYRVIFSIMSVQYLVINIVSIRDL